MGPLILTAFCLWSCVLIVTPLNPGLVGRFTNYIEQNIWRGNQEQYAYFAKLTKDECSRDLENRDFEYILYGDKSLDVGAVMVKKEIYIGCRLAAASYKKEKKWDVHAESRLLNLLPNSTESPISTLLGRPPAAGCVVFFSLNSPCVQTCTDPNGKYNILDKLDRVNLPDYNSRVFAYTKVFAKDKLKPESEVWKNWAALNAKMALLRCKGNNCFKCFNGDVRDQQCYKD